MFIPYITCRYSHFNKILKNRPIRNKNCLWWPCLLTDRDEMSNLYRGPSIDASYQVSVHLAKRLSEEKIFKNRPIRNKNYTQIIMNMNCQSVSTDLSCHFSYAVIFSSPCERQCELLPSLGVRPPSSVGNREMCRIVQDVGILRFYFS
jgi:hypothetical protein